MLWASKPTPFYNRFRESPSCDCCLKEDKLLMLLKPMSTGMYTMTSIQSVIEFVKITKRFGLRILCSQYELAFTCVSGMWHSAFVLTFYTTVIRGIDVS